MRRNMYGLLNWRKRWIETRVELSPELLVNEMGEIGLNSFFNDDLKEYPHLNFIDVGNFLPLKESLYYFQKNEDFVIKNMKEVRKIMGTDYSKKLV